MAGRSGSPGDQYVRQHPQGGYPAGQPGGYRGYPPPGDPARLFGPPPPAPPRPPAPPGRPAGRGRPPRRRLIDYPRAHRSGVLRWIPSWRLVATSSLSFVLVAILALLVAYATTPIPPVRVATEAETTTVLYSDGSPLTKFAQQNRTIVPIGEMSKDIRWSVISAEDRTFYSNKGISPIGIVRAAWNNARGGSLQGGSTITQQYVKNTRIDDSRTWRRKIKEFFIAIKINNDKDKDEILADYLNTIYFGRNTYGIEAAAQAYFGVKAKDLDLTQSAYLAGIINGPELYDVHDGAESTRRAEARFRYVLDGLVELGRLTPEQRSAVDFQADVVKRVKVQKARVSRPDDQTIYLEQLVKEDLARNGYSLDDVSRRGYTIRTTFDRKLIEEAKQAVQDEGIGMGPRSTWPKRTQVGLVSLDPNTGAVRAIYGGDGKTRFQSSASQDKPQAGSVYKPFTLLAALEGESRNGSDGIGLRSRFSGRSPYRYDSRLVGSGSNRVTNFGGEQYGMVDLITATAHSVNTVYAQLNEEIGEGRRTRDAAIRAGLPKAAIGSEVSNTLGNGNPTAVDMASAYGTIAAQGVHHPWYVVESITLDKEVVYRAAKSPHNRASRAFNSDVTADATYALQQVVRDGTGGYASRLRRPVAGKTGTVGGNGRETMAAWFVGFTPQLSTAVVIHREDEKQNPDVVVGWGPYKGRDMQGGMFPVRVWTEFMGRALDGKEKLDFPDPAWVGEVKNPAPPKPTETPSPSASPSPGDGQGNGGPGGDGAPSPSDNNGNNGNNGNGNGNGGNGDPGQTQDPGQPDNGNNGNGNGGGNDGGQSPGGSTP